MLRSIGNNLGSPWSQSWEKRKATVGTICEKEDFKPGVVSRQKRKCQSWEEVGA